MISKIGKEFLKRDIANSLFKKFHQLDGSTIQPDHYYSKARMVGVDTVPSKNKYTNEVLLRKWLGGTLHTLTTGGYTTGIRDNKGVVVLSNPSRINRLFGRLGSALSDDETAAIEHNVPALHELYESKYLAGYKDKLKVVKDPNTAAVVYKNTGKDVPWIERALGKYFFRNSADNKLMATKDGKMLYPMSSHMSLGVLGNEAIDRYNVRTALGRNVLKNLNEYRANSTEDTLLKLITGKTPAVDQYTNEDIKKLEEASLPDSKYRKQVYNVYNPSEKFKVLMV